MRYIEGIRICKKIRVYLTCLEALDGRDRQSIEKRARDEAEASAATPEARERTFRALRDRLLRRELDLPRLELEG